MLRVKPGRSISSSGAWGHAVEQQSSEEHGRRRASRNTHGEEGDHGAADAGVVGGFRRDDPFLASRPEFLGMLGGLLRRSVRNPGSDILANSRHRADSDANQG